MTAILTFLWAASKALTQEASAPQIANPLPVLKGQIGKGKSQQSVPLTGFSPLNPAKLPGVLFALKPSAERGIPVQSQPASQGPNTAFERALERAFQRTGDESESKLSALTPPKTVESIKSEPIRKPTAEGPKPKPEPGLDSPPKVSGPALASVNLPEAAGAKAAQRGPGASSGPRQTAPVTPSRTPKAQPVSVGGPQTPSAKPVNQVSGSGKEAPAGQVPKGGPGSKLITIDVVDLELTKVIQSLSDQTGVNLVLLGQTNKALTLRLNKVPLDSALSHICAVSGLRCLMVKGAYVVAQPEDLRQAYPTEFEAAYPSQPQPPATAPDQLVPPTDPKLDTLEVISLSYVSASEVVDVLKAAFDEKELISRAGPTQHVPSLTSAETSNVTGVSTGILRSDSSSSGASDSGGNPTSRVVVVRGTKDTVEAAKKLAKQLDVARPQVAIAVRILDISDEAMKDLGLSWTFGDQTFTERSGSGIDFRTFDRSAGAIMARLSALKKEDQAKILAEPNISVLDNQKAFILIGQRLNFPTLVGYTQANTPIFAPKEEKVGIYLQVNASVSPTDEITMSLYPQVSTVTSFLEVNGGSYPQIATREAQTTLRVKTGDTIVLGGLIREEEIRNVQKVPLLSDIPVLGEFFKKVKTQKVKSQIIITITPTITHAHAR